ncbi:MAG: DNA gyrase inhibitor YacG [Rhodobacteraceae bacterium]|nr:DNA gyrase inhibitor YacG [Paracoccaceae bacterium]
MTCPICDDETSVSYRPFCSGRCADVDLGKWFNGTYAVPCQDAEDFGNVPVQAEGNLRIKHS